MGAIKGVIIDGFRVRRGEGNRPRAERLRTLQQRLGRLPERMPGEVRGDVDTNAVSPDRPVNGAELEAILAQRNPDNDRLGIKFVNPLEEKRFNPRDWMGSADREAPGAWIKLDLRVRAAAVGDQLKNFPYARAEKLLIARLKGEGQIRHPHVATKGRNIILKALDLRGGHSVFSTTVDPSRGQVVTIGVLMETSHRQLTVGMPFCGVKTMKFLHDAIEIAVDSLEAAMSVPQGRSPIDGGGLE
ncbi:MAG: hypothetical protein HQ596_04465 [Candidatus Saganbacteria bacterium]|nr:hypothetical protein [Candidatus Saganbacteria bacterium]